MNVALLASAMLFPFEALLEFGERAQAWTLELADPALGDLVDRHRIDEVQLLPPLALHRDEVRLLQDREMLRYRLARHGQPLAQLAQRLAVPRVQPVQQPSPARVRQGTEDGVVAHHRNMQLSDCMSSVTARPSPQARVAAPQVAAGATP